MITADVDSFQALMGKSNNALAQDGPEGLPPETRQLGNGAIEAVAKYVRSCFAQDGEEKPLDGDEMNQLVKMLNLVHLKDQLIVDDPVPDVAAFVAEIVRCAKLNPILVAFCAAWAGLTEQEKVCFPERNDERDKEVRHALVYCYLLHTIASTVLREPKGTDLPTGETTFVEKLYELFSKQKEVLDWKPYFSAFGRAKEKSVDMPMKNKVVPYKSGEKQIDDKTSSGALLSVNILEAMMQDVLQGRDDNAQCGFELMMEPNDREEIKGAGNGPDCEWINNGQKTGIQHYFSPLPTAWSNLYSSWNLCFCSNYPNYPVFFAKLLNPVTFGTYHQVDGLYLAPRIVTLYSHLQYVVVTRAKAESSTPPFGDWRSDTLTLLWGRVNKEAAGQYQARLEDIIDDNYGKGTEKAYDLKRGSVRALWATLRGMIKAYKKVKGPEELDSEDEGAEQLMEDLKAEAKESGLSF